MFDWHMNRGVAILAGLAMLVIGCGDSLEFEDERCLLPECELTVTAIRSYSDGYTETNPDLPGEITVEVNQNRQLVVYHRRGLQVSCGIPQMAYRGVLVKPENAIRVEYDRVSDGAESMNPCDVREYASLEYVISGVPPGTWELAVEGYGGALGDDSDPIVVEVEPLFAGTEFSALD